jgi:AcrR family transcriptional regulator
MADQSDTQQRLLHAACQAFAMKGYRDATIQEICNEAEANVAAVNYYFRSKRQLYLAVWEQLYSQAKEYFKATEASNITPRKRLEGLIRQRIEQLYHPSKSTLGQLILHREMSQPTEAHNEIVERFLRPGIGQLISLVGDVLGAESDNETISRCSFAIHAHLVSISVARQPDCSAGDIFGDGLMAVPCETMIEHSVAFLMAGIDAVAAAVNRKGADA